MIEELLDFVGFTFILAHCRLLFNLSSHLLVYGVVDVMVVMSMKAHIGGRHGPPCNFFSPTTHFEALIMTSIAILKANGEIVRPAMIPISSCCHPVVYSAVVKQSWLKLQAVMNGPTHTRKSGALRPPASVAAAYPATTPLLVVPCLNFHLLEGAVKV